MKLDHCASYLPLWCELGQVDVPMCHMFVDVKDFEAQLNVLGVSIDEETLLNFIFFFKFVGLYSTSPGDC